MLAEKCATDDGSEVDEIVDVANCGFSLEFLLYEDGDG